MCVLAWCPVGLTGAGEQADDRGLPPQPAFYAERHVTKIGGVVDLDTAPLRLDDGGIVDAHAVVPGSDRFVVEIECAHLKMPRAASEGGKRILDLQRVPVLAVVEVGQGDIAIEAVSYRLQFRRRRETADCGKVEKYIVPVKRDIGEQCDTSAGDNDAGGRQRR